MRQPLTYRGFGRIRVPLIALVLAAWGPTTAGAGELDVARQHAKIAKQTARDFDRLWRTAKFKKREVEADILATLIVHFSPEHKVAREWLGHTRGDDGWDVPKSPIVRKKAAEKGLAALVTKRQAKIAAALKRLWSLHDKAPGEAHKEARDFILTDIAVLAPGDERLEKERTVLLEDGFWLTADVLRLRRFKERIWHMRRKMVAGFAKPISIPLPPALAKASSLKWVSKLKAGDVPIWGTCVEKEATIIAQSCLIAAQVFADVFRRPRVIPQGFGVVVLTTRDERAKFVRSLGLRGSRAASGAFELPNSGVVVTARWQGWTVRMDSAVRLLIQRLYMEAFGIGRESPWAAQAVGVALTWLTTQTRLTVMGGSPEDHDALERRLTKVLFDGESGWFPSARDVANEGKLPGIPELAPQSRGEIYVRDLLACYVYGLYIVGIRNEVAAEVFSRLGQSEPAEKVLSELLGFSDTDALHAHITRWLNDDALYEEGKSRRSRASGPLPR